VRGLDVRMSRRGGTIKSFTLAGKVGRDAAISGDLRGSKGGRNVIYVESADAGAFFRLIDTYPKIYGGEMWVAMDPPGADPQAPQDGIVNIRDFSVRGEAKLEQVAAGSNTPNGQGGSNKPGVEFSRMRVEFTRTQGRFSIREGLVKGPVIGATLTDGYIDYLNNEVHMRGTIVPFYGLNNMFGQIPLFGTILGGGSNEGLVGLTYEVAGSPSAPQLRVNPISVVAPGLFRKFFEFPTGAATRSQSYADPSR
jgi:AsmA-like C-terminal region